MERSQGHSNNIKHGLNNFSFHSNLRFVGLLVCNWISHESFMAGLESLPVRPGSNSEMPSSAPTVG